MRFTINDANNTIKNGSNDELGRQCYEKIS